MRVERTRIQKNKLLEECCKIAWPWLTFLSLVSLRQLLEYHRWFIFKGASSFKSSYKGAENTSPCQHLLIPARLAILYPQTLLNYTRCHHHLEVERIKLLRAKLACKVMHLISFQINKM